MAKMLILGCENCGTRWKFLRMADEALPGCPSCDGGAREQLAAPSINRGASQPTSWAVPESRSKREDLAYKVAEEQGATNIRTGQKEGDIAAMPVEAPAITAPNGRKTNLQYGFVPAGASETDIASSLKGVGDGNPRVMPLLTAMGRR